MCDSWAAGHGLTIEFNEFYQPVGKMGKRLSTHLGTVARDGKND